MDKVQTEAQWLWVLKIVSQNSCKGTSSTVKKKRRKERKGKRRNERDRRKKTRRNVTDEQFCVERPDRGATAMRMHRAPLSSQCPQQFSCRLRFAQAIPPAFPRDTTRSRAATINTREYKPCCAGCGRNNSHISKGNYKQMVRGITKNFLFPKCRYQKGFLL
jgi:hypothetical protein